MLSYTPRCQSSIKGIFLWESKLQWSHGLAPHPRGSIALRRSPNGSPKKASRASTLASGRRRMDLSAQPPPSSSSQKGNGLKKWQVLIITYVNPRPLRAPALPPGRCGSQRDFPPCSPLDGPAPSPAQDGGLWSHRRGGVGRGWHCQTAVSGRGCDGERGQRALPGTAGGQAALSPGASPVPNCGWP